MLTANPKQEDCDGDGAGRACDVDDSDPSVGKEYFLPVLIHPETY